MLSKAPLILIILFFLNTSIEVGAEVRSERVLSIPLTGTITNITNEMVSEAYNYADDNNLLIVLLIDTPGGSLDATFKIIETIERSNVPTIGYVTPSGARAWSAGTMILLSTHIAAMSPNTIIGSAQPVSYDPAGGGSTPIDDPKIINALLKYIEERARRNNRNPEIAAKFITENLNLNNIEAQAAGVVEYNAGNLVDLLQQIDGEIVDINEVETTLKTRSLSIEDWTPSPRIALLNIVSDPLISYLFFIIGFYALYFGLQTPGLGIEVVGVFSLTLGLIGLGVIGINIGALVILALGFGLLIAEVVNPGFGILGITGLIMTSLGSFLLFPGEWAVSSDWLNTFYTTLILIPLLIGIFVIVVLFKVIEARRKKPYQTNLIGRIGEAQSEIKFTDGYVLIDGERWRAKSEKTIEKGVKVEVISKEGPILIVKTSDKN